MSGNSTLSAMETSSSFSAANSPLPGLAQPEKALEQALLMVGKHAGLLHDTSLLLVAAGITVPQLRELIGVIKVAAVNLTACANQMEQAEAQIEALRAQMEQTPWFY